MKSSAAYRTFAARMRPATRPSGPDRQSGIRRARVEPDALSVSVSATASHVGAAVDCTVSEITATSAKVGCGDRPVGDGVVRLTLMALDQQAGFGVRPSTST